MPKCNAKLTSGKQGRPLRIRCCGKEAIVLTPTGFFEGRQVWLCANHAPTKLVPSRKAPNVAGNRLAEGKSELTGLLGGPTRGEKE